MTREDVIDIITEYEAQYGSALGDGSVRELTPQELTDENLRVLTIPGLKPSTQEWVQTSLYNMLQPINHAVSDLSTLKAETIEAKNNANSAAASVGSAIADAERVNATLVGMTVTITDHSGTSRSVNIGFEIYRTYSSVNAMKADAANVPQGKFVIIATSDPTATENAQLWCRNSAASTAAEPFVFLSDLDQASSAAWSDWLNNMKPTIQADHNTAVSDHNTAVSDHSTANSDHDRAGEDHAAAEQATAAANRQAYRAKAYNDHPWEIGDDGFIYVWDEQSQAMVRTNKMIIDFTELTPEQRQSMIDEFYQTLTYASVAESQAAANELT